MNIQSTAVVIHLVFTSLAILLMNARLLAKRLLFHRFDLGDYLTTGAIVFAAARGCLIYVVLHWGTNNLSAQARADAAFTDEDVYRRTVGSKLIISNRPIYNGYLWLQKLVLLYFCVHHYYPKYQWRSRIVWSYGSIFAATYIAALIVGFTECDPFHLYWQVTPAPGSCVTAQTQLLVLGILNISTDIMLLLLPLPSLWSLKKISWKVHLRLFIICTLGLFIIAITIIRLPINSMHASVQACRSSWASTELLISAIVVNAPTLYGAFNRWRKDGKVSSDGSLSSRGNGRGHRYSIGSTPTKGAMRDISKEEDDVGIFSASRLPSETESDKSAEDERAMGT